MATSLAARAAAFWGRRVRWHLHCVRQAALRGAPGAALAAEACAYNAAVAAGTAGRLAIAVMEGAWG